VTPKRTALPEAFRSTRTLGPEALERLIYVVGTARGGTTLLGACLGLHHGVLGLPENSNFMSQVWRYQHIVDDRLIRVLLAQPYYYKREEALADLPSQARDKVTAYLTAVVARRDLFGMYTLYPLVHGLLTGGADCAERVLAWSDKATDTRGLGALGRVFPELKVVFLTRDPRGAVASLAIRSARREARDADADRLDLVLEQAIHWRRVTQDMLRFRRRFGASALLIRYEDLVGAPVEVLNRIFSFAVGRAVEPAILAERLAGLTYFASNDPGQLQRGIRTDSVERWRAVLKPDELALIAAVTGPTARQLGYDLGRAGSARALRQAARLPGGPRAKGRALAKLAYLAMRQFLTQAPA
jgi:hypothetical protein